MPAKIDAIFLVGFMGAGKSSVGAVLAKQLGWTFEDLDDYISRREGTTVAEIFRISGEREFRRMEREALQQLLAELPGSQRVIALGGGAFVNPVSARRLKAAAVPTVFLDAPIEELWTRCAKQASMFTTERPLLTSLEEFGRLYHRRRKGYLKASLRIETGRRSVAAVVTEIARALELQEQRSKKRRNKKK